MDIWFIHLFGIGLALIPVCGIIDERAKERAAYVRRRLYVAPRGASAEYLRKQAEDMFVHRTLVRIFLK